tara:strand:+ start:1633 stop:1983 length:351 start_codon:yes stop_codon:yes gene_type:complete
MKQTINQTQFINAFTTEYCSKDNFSYEGLELLYEYFEDVYSDTGVEMELDVVGICCDFSEMDITEFLQAYNPLTISEGEFNDLSENDQVSLLEDYLCSETSFIGYTDNKTFVFAQW